MRKLIAAALLALTACVGQDRAARVLKEQGYTDIEITGYRWLGCSDDDQFHAGFKAKSPAHVPVTGVVCSGFTKGSTIRLD